MAKVVRRVAKAPATKPIPKSAKQQAKTRKVNVPKAAGAAKAKSTAKATVRRVDKPAAPASAPAKKRIQAAKVRSVTGKGTKRSEPTEAERKARARQDAKNALKRKNYAAKKAAAAKAAKGK
mgnify:CR=1 FL=1